MNFNISHPMIPICVGCGKRPEEINEYWDVMERNAYGSPTEAVLNEEGTLNKTNGHFYCTKCYILAGMPLGVAP